MLVMNLYTKIQYGQFNNRNKQVIELAQLIGKTPGAVAYKLVHLSSQDPFHQNRGIKGLANPGKNAIAIYKEFQEDWNEMLFQSEVLLAKMKNTTIEEEYPESIKSSFSALKGKEGVDVKRNVKSRVGQNLFRKIVLNNYSTECTICRLNIDNLLIASHILKWSESPKERLNPSNGLCLCSIHDKAFETGYIAISPDYKIKISSKIDDVLDPTKTALFDRHENEKIVFPDKFYPDPKFLDFHCQTVFIQ